MTLQDTGNGLKPAWTGERIDRLRSLFAEKLSFSQIAAALGGVSRNAVIGKAHRLGLFGAYIRPKRVNDPIQPKPQRTAPIDHGRVKRLVGEHVQVRPGQNSSRRKEVQVIAPAEIRDLPPDTSEFACTIHELGSVVERDRCRWPLGDPSADMHYCGAPSVGSWCARHRAIVSGKPERT